MVDGSDGGGGRRQSLAAGPQWSACGGGLLSGIRGGRERGVSGGESGMMRISRAWDEGMKFDALAAAREQLQRQLVAVELALKLGGKEDGVRTRRPSSADPQRASSDSPPAPAAAPSADFARGLPTLLESNGLHSSWSSAPAPADASLEGGPSDAPRRRTQTVG